MIQTSSNQYSLSTIIGLWAMVSLPMAAIRFLILPWAATVFPVHPGVLFWCLIVVGMAWQFVLSLILLKRELGRLDWQEIKTRLRLNHPKAPGSGEVRKGVYWLTIPVILYIFAVSSTGWFAGLNQAWVTAFPAFALPDNLKIEALASPEFHGAWPLIIVMLVSSVFNYLLGEELFFRGILLPKMRGVFGKADWAANGVFFAAYHLHKIEALPVLLVSRFVEPFLNSRYRSSYPGLIIHGVEFIPVAVVVVLVVLGLL